MLSVSLTQKVSLFQVGPGDGPTCFLPGTQYLALDREGLGQGEERLDPKMLPPKTAAQWHDAISGFTDSNPNPYAETDARRVEGMKLMGVPGLQENPMTIAEEDRGMIVLWQNDVFHRRSRQLHDEIQDYPAPLGHDYSDDELFPGSNVTFRPYVRMGFFRTAEPAAPAWVDAGSADGWGEAAAPTGHGEDTLDDVAAGLFQPRLEWFAGESRSTLHERSAEEVAALGAQLKDGSEAVRMTAAGNLAHTMGDLGLEPLLTAMAGPVESPARAATYGLACSGDAAVAPLIALLAGPAAPVPAGSASSSALEDRPFYRKDKVAFALGRAASTAESLRAAVDALAEAITDAVADITMITAHLSPAEVEEAAAYAMSGGRGYGGDCYAGRVVPDQRSDDARGLLMEAGRSLGLLGSKAVAMELSELALRIVAVLAPLVNDEDKGALLPSRHSNTDLVQSNAALGMLNMVSTADCPAALLSSERAGLELTLPTFARLQREEEAVGAGGDPAQHNKKEPKLADRDGKALLPSAFTAGKTREYLQLAVGRLQWLVGAGKAGAAHEAILTELEESGLARQWGVTDATLLPPVV